MHSSSLKLKSMIQQLEDARYTWRSYSLKQLTIKQKERRQPKANQLLQQQVRSQSQSKERLGLISRHSCIQGAPNLFKEFL
jgi:hypothetical protein